MRVAGAWNRHASFRPPSGQVSVPFHPAGPRNRMLPTDSCRQASRGRARPCFAATRNSPLRFCFTPRTKQMIIEPILLWTWTLGFLQANAQSRAAPSHRPDDDVWSARCRVTNCDFHQARYWPGLSRIISVRRTVRILTGFRRQPSSPP